MWGRSPAPFSKKVVLGMLVTFQPLGILLAATPLASREVRGRTMPARAAPRGNPYRIVMIAFQEWERLQAYWKWLLRRRQT